MTAMACIRRAPPLSSLSPLNVPQTFARRRGDPALPCPVPTTLLGHGRDLFVLPVLSVSLPVSHQRLPLLQLPLVLGHQRGVDAAVSRRRHHHDAHDAAHHAGNHHRADGSAHAHRSIAGADAISRSIPDPSSSCYPRVVPAAALVRRRRGPAGAESVPAAGSPAPLSGSRGLASPVLVLQLEAVVEHFHWHAADVPPTQVLG